MGKRTYPRIESRTLLCRGKRFSLYQVRVVDERGETSIKDLLVHPGAVAILPILDEDRVVLLRQYRPGPDDWVYEVPAGTIEPGEDPRETALRELEEETGYTAASLEYVGSLLPSPGVSTERIYLFIARGLAKLHEPSPEKGEYIEVFTVGIEEAVRLVLSSPAMDAKTLALLLLYTRSAKPRAI